MNSVIYSPGKEPEKIKKESRIFLLKLKPHILIKLSKDSLQNISTGDNRRKNSVIYWDTKRINLFLKRMDLSIEQ